MQKAIFIDVIHSSMINILESLSVKQTYIVKEFYLVYNLILIVCFA